ncbi:MAG: hypothetical protein ACK46S_03445 [Bacteroidota bacterium]
MEKNHKKDLEQLLLRQTEKVFREIDPAVAIIFSKNIKSHCKDLAKKFLKTQKKFQKQMEAIGLGDKAEVPENKLNGESKQDENKKVAVKKTNQIKVVEKVASSVAATPKKTGVKKIRILNKLINAVSNQNK